MNHILCSALLSTVYYILQLKDRIKSITVNKPAHVTAGVYGIIKTGSLGDDLRQMYTRLQLICGT